MKPLLVLARTIFVGCLWSIIFIEGVRVIMLENWHFDIFWPMHWAHAWNLWLSGWVIDTPKEWAFVLILVAFIPLWLTGWIALSIVSWEDLIVRALMAPVRFGNSLFRPIKIATVRAPVIVKKKSYKEIRPTSKRTPIYDYSDTSKTDSPTTSAAEKTPFAKPLNLRPKTPSVTEMPTQEKAFSHAIFNLDDEDDDFDLDFDSFEKSDLFKNNDKKKTPAKSYSGDTDAFEFEPGKPAARADRSRFAQDEDVYEEDFAPQFGKPRDDVFGARSGKRQGTDRQDSRQTSKYRVSEQEDDDSSFSNHGYNEDQRNGTYDLDEDSSSMRRGYDEDDDLQENFASKRNQPARDNRANKKRQDNSKETYRDQRGNKNSDRENQPSRKDRASNKEMQRGASRNNDSANNYGAGDVSSANPPRSNNPVADVLTQRGYDLITNLSIKGVIIDFAAVSNDKICLCLVDKEQGDWLADEERFNNEEPLWFSESSHRISPVRKMDLAREAVYQRLHDTDFDLELKCYVVEQAGNIINAEDMFEIWDEMGILVTRISRGSPKEIRLFSKSVEEAEGRLSKEQINVLKKIIRNIS